jgi:hypothetical protein
LTTDVVRPSVEWMSELALRMSPRCWPNPPADLEISAEVIVAKLIPSAESCVPSRKQDTQFADDIHAL